MPVYRRKKGKKQILYDESVIPVLIVKTQKPRHREKALRQSHMLSLREIHLQNLVFLLPN